MIIKGKKPPRFTITVIDLETGENYTHTNMEGLVIISGRRNDKDGMETTTMVHGAPRIVIPIILGWDEIGKDIKGSVAKSVADDILHGEKASDDIPDVLKKMFGGG